MQGSVSKIFYFRPVARGLWTWGGGGWWTPGGGGGVLTPGERG